MKKYIASFITGCRILCSILMLFFPAFSVSFYTMYFICGLSDMLDGAVARKIKISSSFGASFDTAADFIFVSAAMVKLLPLIPVPVWLTVWIAAIAIIKIVNAALGFILNRKPMAVHSAANKVTGLLLFLFPLTLNFIELKLSAVIICFIATFSAIEEGYFVVTARETIIQQGRKKYGEN